MATFNKTQDYIEQVHKGLHDWSSDTFRIAFSNTSIDGTVATLSGVTQISDGGGYTQATPPALDSVVLAETTGTAKVTVADEVFTATGSVNTCQYFYYYNDTNASDGGVGYLNYGSGITLATDESITFDHDATNGLFQAA